MNGYVDGGYIVAIGSLFSYGVSLVVRERAARVRLGVTARELPQENEANDAEFGPDGAIPPQ